MVKKNAEAVIIGGGVMGCSILYNLANKGMRDVLLFEKDVLCSGSTGKSQAILRMHYSNPVTTSMAWESLNIFQNFEQILGHVSGYVKTGYVVLTDREDSQALKDNVDMQKQLGVETCEVNREELREIAPMLNADDAVGIAYEPQSGYADPYLVSMGYSQAARDLGAEIYVGNEIIKIIVSNGRVKAVVTNEGVVETSNVIIATGPWSSKVLGGLGIDVPLETYRHQIIMVHRPSQLALSHPAVGDVIQGFSFRPDSVDLTLIGIREDLDDLDSYNQGVDENTAEEAIGKLIKRIPAMSEGYFRGGWAGLFTVTPDWHPILDKIPDIDGLYCSIGFSGHGFKLSPMVGLCMAELITEGTATSLDISSLRLSRFENGNTLGSKYRLKVLA